MQADFQILGGYIFYPRVQGWNLRERCFFQIKYFSPFTRLTVEHYYLLQDYFERRTQKIIRDTFDRKKLTQFIQLGNIPHNG